MIDRLAAMDPHRVLWFLFWIGAAILFLFVRAVVRKERAHNADE